jgi:MFS family permease
LLAGGSRRLDKKRKAEERQPLLSNPDGSAAGQQLSASELRWWALVVFSTMSAVQNAIWISFSVVVDPACDFFGVGTGSINFLASLGPLVLIPVAFITGPMSRSMGLRAVVVLGCGLTALGAVLRVPAIFFHNHRYAWAVLGHAINAAAGPVIMSCPPLLSSTWFPLHERTTATAIAYNAQIFGIAFGWAVEPYIVTEKGEVPRLIWLEAAFGVVTLLVGLTFPPAPATAPTVSAGEERAGFWSGVSILLRRPAFMGLAALWSISAGVNGGWATLLDVFLKDKQTNVEIGWIGFGGSLAGAAGGVVAGVLIDRFDQSLKWGMIAVRQCNVGRALACACDAILSIA